MYILLKKNKFFFVFILIIISISISCIFLKKNNFINKPLITIDEINYDQHEYEDFIKILKSGINPNKDLPIIAHAGGGYKNLTYTNSIDSLQLNKKNYELFELDFFLTDDGKLVCAHDWSINLKTFSQFQIMLKKRF